MTEQLSCIVPSFPPAPLTSIHPVPFGVNFIFPLLALVLISLDCTSRFPPNCGEVSSTTLEMPLPPPLPATVEIPVILQVPSTVITGIADALP